MRFGSFARVPDLVVWPGSHEHVEGLVRLANEHDVVVIPFGGGTSVSGALECPAGERRMIVSLDMREMNAIKVRHTVTHWLLPAHAGPRDQC